MEKIALMVLCGVMISATAFAATADPKDEKAVIGTLEAMAKATISKDTATLEKIYADDLTYSHSSALTENKATVIQNVKGPNVAVFMKFSEMSVRTYGNVALAKGICDFRNGAPGSMTDNHLNILWVLVKGPGPLGWQIVARQTTRIGPSVGTPVPASASAR